MREAPHRSSWIWVFPPGSEAWVGVLLLSNRLSQHLCSGAKHIPLSSQRPFRFHCSIGTLFSYDQTNTILWLWVTKVTLMLFNIVSLMTKMLNPILSFKVLKNHFFVKSCNEAFWFCFLNGHSLVLTQSNLLHTKTSSFCNVSRTKCEVC